MILWEKIMRKQNKEQKNPNKQNTKISSDN